jgi:hypothetical protein
MINNLPIIQENKINLNLTNANTTYGLNTIKNIVENIPAKQNIFDEINKVDDGFDVYYNEKNILNENIFRKKAKPEKASYNVINNFNINIFNSSNNNETFATQTRTKILKPLKPNIDMLNREMGNKRLSRARHNSKIHKNIF